MRIGRIEVKRRVWFGLVFALSAVGAWWVWSRTTEPQAVARPRTKPSFVRLANSGLSTSDRILRERAEYFDPTPLFFPTEWNYGQGLLQENLRREPEQVFGSFEPNLPFADQYFKVHGLELTPVVERLADILGQGNERPLGGMGQIDRVATSLEARSGFLEVSSLLDGKLVMKQPFTDIILSHPDFKPLEFIAVVSSGGLVGEPLLVSGSGWEELDTLLRSYLVKTLRLGERLNPGRYRIVVGP